MLAALTSVRGWTTFLQQSDTVIAIPLLVAGLLLLVLGWRMWRICVGLSFAWIGAAAATSFLLQGESQFLFKLIAAVAFGSLAFALARYALCVLGGLVAALILVSAMTALGLHGPSMAAAGALGMVAGVALTWTNAPHVIVLLSSLQGAVLLNSGLTVALMTSPGLYRSLHGLASSSVYLFAFLLLVPTAMSCFYQFSEINRIAAGIDCQDRTPRPARQVR